jgi:hypothetical protein
MLLTEVVRRWIVVAAQILGLGGSIYEVFWNHGNNPNLLRFYEQLLLAGASATVPWKSLLQGFQLRLEIREPRSSIPTLLIDLGTLARQQAESPNTQAEADPRSDSRSLLPESHPLPLQQRHFEEGSLD